MHQLKPTAFVKDAYLQTLPIHIKEAYLKVIRCTDKKEKKTFLIYKEIQMGSVAKSYMRAS
jgi:hypothetical protein